MKKVREGYKMTELGEIPEEWEIKNIGKLCNVTKLAGFEFTEYIKYIDDGEIIALRALNLKKGKLDLTDIKRIDRQVSEKLERSRLNKDDIVFSYVGTVGEVAIIPETGKYHLAPNVAKITIQRDTMPEFLVQYLVSSYADKEIRKLITTTSQPALSMENIREIKMVLPSMAEQMKISSILSSVDEQIENIDILIEKAKKLKKGLMQRLLTKGIGHERLKDTEIGKIPEKWKVARLGDIAHITMGQSPNGDSYNNIGEGIPLLNGPTEFSNKYPIAKQWTNKPTKICEVNDILFCVRGSSTGRMNIANERYCIGRGLASIRGINNSSETKYIYQTLIYKLDSLLSLSAGSTFPNIGRDDLNSALVPLPSFAEQQKIFSILSSVDERVDQYESEKEKLQELKKGLMQNLLTGKIRVNYISI